MTRVRVRVRGVVQGVGYRPFAHALAAELGVAGFVGNDPAGVFAEAEGPAAAVEAFVAGLRDRAPVLAVVEDVSSAPLSPTGHAGFVIVPSAPDGRRVSPVSADAATCADCLAELWDPADRRYRYPFVNCTNCGPRFTVVTGIPYDRPLTTMAGFEMCADCAREYADPADRRFHAQPVCCPACGPRLTVHPAEPGDPVIAVAGMLGEGAIVAVKGLGGYHLACDATDDAAVAELRARKHREERPFAVLAASLAAAAELGRVSPDEAALLSGRRRPIVLLDRRPGAPLAPSVAPGSQVVGVMLPYTPLHHLLAAAVDRPLVLTSGNVSDEPIAYEDRDAAARLAGIADAILRHDRPIATRVDDSVVRMVRGRPVPVRRSRGYAPEPLTLPWPARRPVLGCGAELKSTFCLLRDRHAVLSHHVGDLENWETHRSYVTGIEHYRRLFAVRPEVVAHDLHPDYLSTAYAERLAEEQLDSVELTGVQHHHAHVASCLADNGHPGPVLGLALDGTGYGPDGTLWGGELLVADLVGYRRVGHLAPVGLPGGAAAIRQPWRMAAAYLGPGDDHPVARRHADRWDAVVSLGRTAVRTSSAGRLFDAVAAVAGVRDVVSYEGQAAVELEQRVDRDEAGGYPARVAGGVLHGVDLVRAAATDVLAGAPAGVVAARFHTGLAAALVELVEAARAECGLSTVALSGGVLQNAVLHRRLVDGLTARGFEVLVHFRVPPNDGGISLGQAVVAAARDRAGLLRQPLPSGAAGS